MKDLYKQTQEIKYFKKCRVRCELCGDVLEYKNKTKQDNSSTAIWCSCKKTMLDASAYLYQIGGNPVEYDDLSELWEETELDGEELEAAKQIIGVAEIDPTLEKDILLALDRGLTNIQINKYLQTNVRHDQMLTYIFCVRRLKMSCEEAIKHIKEAYPPEPDSDVGRVWDDVLKFESECDSDNEIHGPFDTVEELMAALNSDDKGEGVGEID